MTTAHNSAAHPPTTSDFQGQHIFLPFLAQQSQQSLSRLYTKPSTCLAIFRLLRPLERQLVLNLLWLETSIPSATMLAWVTREGKKQYSAALAVLISLFIVSNSPTKLQLTPQFKAGFRSALTGSGEHQSFGNPSQKDPRAPTIDFLDSYAQERWEIVLHYMVASGTGQTPQRPSNGVLLLLQQSGLMTNRGVSRITSQGFQFLLESPHAQLWDLLLHYLSHLESRSLDLVDSLQVLFMVSTMQLGRGYSTVGLTESQLTLLADLNDYGLVWQKNGAPHTFYPTRLGTALTSSSPLIPNGRTDGTGPSQGFIILETNYRLYAYTDNPLQTAVLNLFVSLKTRFPNLVVGSITRESVKKALSNGITADQIISYLITHAHPQMEKNNPLIPVTVQDQIRLWEQEKNRVKTDEGYLWTGFKTQADFDLIRDYAKQIEVILWENLATKSMFLTLEGHESCKAYVERRREQIAQQGGA